MILTIYRVAAEIGTFIDQSGRRQITRSTVSQKKREHHLLLPQFPISPHILKMVSQLVWKRASASRGVSKTIASIGNIVTNTF